MSNWAERQVSAWIDRRIDRYVDRKVDALVEPYVGAEKLKQLKKMTREGQPLDPETEAILSEHLSADQLTAYKGIHNGVARLERWDRGLRQITRVLP